MRLRDVRQPRQTGHVERLPRTAIDCVSRAQHPTVGVPPARLTASSSRLPPIPACLVPRAPAGVQHLVNRPPVHRCDTSQGMSWLLAERHGGRGQGRGSPHAPGPQCARRSDVDSAGHPQVEPRSSYDLPGNGFLNQGRLAKTLVVIPGGVQWGSDLGVHHRCCH